MRVLAIFSLSLSAAGFAAVYLLITRHNDLTQLPVIRLKPYVIPLLSGFQPDSLSPVSHI